MMACWEVARFSDLLRLWLFSDDVSQLPSCPVNSRLLCYFPPLSAYLGLVSASMAASGSGLPKRRLTAAQDVEVPIQICAEAVAIERREAILVLWQGTVSRVVFNKRYKHVKYDDVVRYVEEIKLEYAPLKVGPCTPDSDLTSHLAFRIYLKNKELWLILKLGSVRAWTGRWMAKAGVHERQLGAPAGSKRQGRRPERPGDGLVRVGGACGASIDAKVWGSTQGHASIRAVRAGSSHARALAGNSCKRSEPNQSRERGPQRARSRHLAASHSAVRDAAAAHAGGSGAVGGPHVGALRMRAQQLQPGAQCIRALASDPARRERDGPGETAASPSAQVRTHLD